MGGHLKIRMLSFVQRSGFKKIPVKPLGSRVIVELNKENQGKIGSLYVPESAQKTPNQATVVAVGPGAKVNGIFVPTTLKVGQKVLMPQFGGQVIKYEKGEYTVISEEDILAVFE